MLEINFTVKENNKIISFPVFYKFGIDKDDKCVSIQVHPRFQHVLNYFKFGGQFTRINLLEIISLKSDYAKKLYPILKQFESTGDERYTDYIKASEFDYQF
ncbi:RepB family plasmid replication initiator protein [Spiroplasma endosymbiont of Colias croceus]|uniref:RepB family plasmid replication initiator protein n=1 Tax=Spiroplasma endosymbiont of Colias croceus TaxID=3066310 RepID=UPI003BB09868